MRKYLFSITCFLSAVLSAQNGISLSGEFTGFNNCDSLLYAKLNLQNTSSENQNFWIMTCGWESSWLISIEDLFISPWDCDKNHPTLISLKPGESIDFYIDVHINKNIRQLRKVSTKFGFVFIPERELLPDSIMELYDEIVLKKRNLKDVVWSDTVKIDYYHNTFHLPAKG